MTGTSLLMTWTALYVCGAPTSPQLRRNRRKAPIRTRPHLGCQPGGARRFLCCWYRRALAGCHRLASGLVRSRKDTHCLRSSSDRWAGKCGVSASDRLCVGDVHGCDDSFRVSQDRAAPDRGAERGERSPEYLSGRARSTRLVSSLVSRGLTARGEQAGRPVGRI
jgi:hypothetical protein